ncbi:alpha/beta fold hydrolase [Microvirga sp. 3-52]|jgi:10-carbomethoxy-13-deoxycarminomycin esterase/esterase|uniref:alpha/beta fold hydrolase n=1 Tax=Microvirga sp. 3-52 TaxID=2792425 RepID=UPI001ACC1743|nr:alpha/beta fold hydrolase [Microvirga sp. 3-52]MBO1908169.1 alpha/beta fold hydrolase [Microvirga sp. 3-52]MBS7454604.1 alpha/beta fold hydrolase [Microvirga sp. 3-52]
MRGKLIRAGEVTLWLEEIGPPGGDVVLLVAGANGSAFMWPDGFVALLADKGYRVIRYDHRDTGRSTRRPFDEHPYGIEDLARDAVAILDACSVGRAHVVGLSMGGTIGQVLALDHLERLSSLTLMLTTGLDVDFAGNYLRAMRGEPPVGSLPTPRPDVVAELGRMFTPGATLEDELQRRVEQWRVLAGDVLPFDPDEFRRIEAAAIEHTGSLVPSTAHARIRPVPTKRGEELRRVRTPALVIQGREDPLNPPPHGRHLANLIPGATLVEIPGLGHALPSVAHERIAKVILGHMRQHPTRVIDPEN